MASKFHRIPIIPISWSKDSLELTSKQSSGEGLISENIQKLKKVRLVCIARIVLAQASTAFMVCLNFDSDGVGINGIQEETEA